MQPLQPTVYQVLLVKAWQVKQVHFLERDGDIDLSVPQPAAPGPAPFSGDQLLRLGPARDIACPLGTSPAYGYNRVYEYH